MTGRGKGAKKEVEKKVKKSRKILRDNIQGINKSAIKRLALLAGCDRLSGLMYEEIRGTLKVMLEDYIKDMIVYMEYRKKKTLDYDVLKYVMERNNEKLLGGKGTKYDTCKSLSDIYETKTKVKAKVATCVFIAKLKFVRLVKEICQYYAEDVRLSEDFKENFQFFIEQKIIKLLAAACNVAMEIGGRNTVMPKDLQIVRQYGCKLTGDITSIKPRQRKKTTTKKTTTKKTTTKKVSPKKVASHIKFLEE